MDPVDLVLMSGWSGSSDVERLVDGARRAVARDLIDKALSTHAFERIIVATNDPVLAEMVDNQVIVDRDPPDEAFHFGRRLQQVIARYQIERVVYLGGGCAPLLPGELLRDMAQRVRTGDRLLLANNFYSIDFCAFTPASALLLVDPPANDNALGWLLVREAGLRAEELPRSAVTTFDLDTPTDLSILSLHSAAPWHVRTYLDGLALDTHILEAAISVFVRRQSEVVVAGRISSRVMAYLEQETLCRTRIFAEARGMRAGGQLAQGKVRSLLGMHLQSVGVETFFQHVLPQLGQAVFLDDRVLWAHLGMWPPAGDRFNSDLYRSEQIADPFIRRFTQAAMECPVPVVLGGHSLVAGGLYVLVEAAWARGGIDVQRTVTSLSADDLQKQ